MPIGTDGAVKRDRHDAVAPHVSRVHAHEPGFVDGEVGEARQQLLERDAGFEAGEGGAEAEMDAEAEGDVVGGVAVDVEDVGVRPAALVAIRRGEQQGDLAAGLACGGRGARRRG